jgi:membrane protease YdiL (CAAX protease family)
VGGESEESAVLDVDGGALRYAGVNAPLADRARLSTATVVGLLLALAGPPFVSIVAAAFQGGEQSPARIGWGMVIHWVNLAAVVLVVLRAERRPLTSIGLRRLAWWTIPLGLIAGVLATVITGILVKALNLGGDLSLAFLLLSLPFATRLLVVITAGVFEETLYRGYAFERLATWLNSKWAAAGVTLLMFTLGHIPAVGLDHLAPVLIVSTLITLLYLWRRDLVLNMVAHATVDGIALLLGPALAHASG